jgi:hypothetical protein
MKMDELDRRKLNHLAGSIGLRRALGESDKDFEKRVNAGVQALPAKRPRPPLPRNPAWRE